MKYFAIGDIHGCFEPFSQLVRNHWNSDNEQLILTGDLIDRGPRSYECIVLAKQLHEKYGAIILQGNHECEFLMWLDHQKDAGLYWYDDLEPTIKSFYNDENAIHIYEKEQIAAHILKNFQSEIHFLRQAHLYFETPKYLFVHAGVDLTKENWKDTEEADYYWIREDFINGVNSTGKRIVFGHTTTRELHSLPSDDVWFSPCKTKIGIDGGVVFGGKLHGIRIDEENDKINIISV
ncbi:serine/threonine protein phosphatase 1 [Bacillus sp. OV194]|nr:serine/threonine protein phosphatase 1 [Bacillus sp. OV194]